MKKAIWVIILLGSSPGIFAQGIMIEEPVKMLALGDSYTIGASVDVEERWPHQFVAKLKARGIAAETPDYIAATGWTTQALLGGIERQMDTARAYNLVSILIGVNNQYQGLPIDSYEPDLRKIIEHALEVVSNDTGKVFMVSIPDYAYTPFGNGDAVITQGINAYNDINYRIARDYNLTYVNITTISRRGLAEPGLVAGDGLHPSGEQYALWVEAILSWLESGPSVGLLSESSREKGTLPVIRLYPNPSPGSIRIITSSPFATLRILDVQGKYLWDLFTHEEEMVVDLTGLNNGIYFIEGTHARTRQVVPFILDDAF